MSSWTHIVAVIDVDTYKEDKNIKEAVEAMLIDAPKITGSESDADVFVNVLSRYNHWIGADCEHCEYGNTIVHLEDGGFQCNAEKDYECPEGEYQSRVVITVIGDLRDRSIKRTREEYKAFYNYFKDVCKFMIRNKSVKILNN